MATPYSRMMVAERRGRGQRAGLTHDAVVVAAGELIRASGADGFSVRGVAARLGVAPNALYAHIESRTALIDAVLDARLESIPAPDVAAPPLREIRACMTRTFDVLVDAAELVPLYLARHGSRGPRATELGAALEVLLERVGVSRADAALVVRTLVLVTIGFAAQAVEDGPLPASEFRQTLSASVGWLVEGAGRPTGPISAE